MRLHDRIAARIRAEGPLRFDVFQEAALYDAEGGYYERAGRVGRTGDFVTGPSWHPAFGRTIARIARRLWKKRGEKRREDFCERGRGEKREREKTRFLRKGKRAQRPGGAGESRAGLADVVDIVDVGAGEGELLAAADSALRAWGIREQFRLVGVERSATRREIAQSRCPSATWLSSFEEIPSSSLSGVVIAYELFDALPVRALFFEGEKLLERVVTLGPGGEGFAWGLAECVDGEELLQSFRSRGIHLLRNQLLEVRSGAAGLASALASRLSRGILLVFDYGAPAKALYSAARANGTLEAFVVPRRHARRADGARQPRPDGMGRLFGARGRVHGRRAFRRGPGEPVARPRVGRDLRGPRDRSRRSPGRRARSGPPGRRRPRPARGNGGVDPRPPRVPGHGSRVDAFLLAAT